jgi:hypothetical protein
VTAIKEIALPREDKQNRIYYTTRNAMKEGKRETWKRSAMERFFVYVFLDKIIQFLSKPEIRNLFSKKIGKIYTNCSRTFYKY